MGGEKLNIRKKVFAAAVLIVAGLQLISYYPMSAQEVSDEIRVSGIDLSESNNTDAATALFPGEESINLDEESQTSQVRQSTSLWVVFQMVLVLALAALAIYGVIFFIKRLARPRQTRDPHLKILASAPIGSGAFAAVLSVGSKAWLVGGGDSGVSLIAEIDEQEALESMLIDEAARNADIQTGGFPDFRSLLRKFTKSQTASGQKNIFESHAENLRKQRDRLRGL